MADMQVRQLTLADVDDVKRLHKYAMYNNRPVFGQYSDDAAEILQAAAMTDQGTFGYVALATDPEEPDEPEVVGALTAQLSPTTTTSSRSSNNDAGQASVTLEVPESNPAPDSSDLEVVLLTLVVRADARKQGVGRQLLQALLQHALHLSTRKPLKQIVTDIALNNKPAWRFFQQYGFKRSAAASHGKTAEAVLLLEPVVPASQGAPQAAAASGPTRGPAACQVRAAKTSGALLSCHASINTNVRGWNCFQPGSCASQRCQPAKLPGNRSSCQCNILGPATGLVIRRPCTAGSRSSICNSSRQHHTAAVQQQLSIRGLYAACQQQQVTRTSSGSHLGHGRQPLRVMQKNRCGQMMISRYPGALAMCRLLV